MAWTVRFSQAFERWLRDLKRVDQDALAVDMGVLAAEGPRLGRPQVDTIKGSRHANMKELRTGTLRCLFAFDLKREAYMTVGGDKKGKNSDLFYRALIKQADEILDHHLARQAAEIAQKRKEEEARKKQKTSKRRKR